MRWLQELATLAAVCAFAGTEARATTFTFSDQNFPNANWTIPDSLFLDPSQTGQRLTGGNPGAYRQTGVIFAERPDYAANLNTTFVYTPAIQGPITGITYNMDLEAISAIGSTYAPVISQNGVLFYDPLETAYNSENIWLNYNLVLNLDHFTPLHGGPATPNFVTGSAITFGYLVSTGGAEFYESISGIDNDPITLTTRSANVPEPATVLLLCTAALALFTVVKAR